LPMALDLRPPRYRPKHARPSVWTGPRRGLGRSSLSLAVASVVLVVAAGAIVGPRLVGHGARGAHVAGLVDRDLTTPSSAPASLGPPPVVFHRLRVTTHPDGAALQIHAADGSSRKVHAPFTGNVAGPDVELTLSLPGFNTLDQAVDLHRNRSLDLWLDPKGQLLHKLGQFDTGPAPKQAAFTPDGSEMWISDLGGGVDVFDPGSGKRVAHIDLNGKSGVEVIFTKDGSTAYVSQMETASVYEIDVATRTIKRHLFTTGSWSKVMALSPNERKLYVSNWVSDDVSEIDLVKGKETRRFHTVDTPRGLYVTPDGKRLYVAGFGDGRLERFRLRDLRSKIVLDTGGALRHLVGDPARGLLYADDMATDEVFVVDLATERARKLADTDHTPNTIDLSPDGKVLYVSNRGRNNAVSYYLPGPEWGSVLAIDTATGRLLDAIVGGNQTTGLDVSPDGKILAFSDFLDNRVTLYAIPGYQVLAAGGGGRAKLHLADLEK
jgi:DNA-binding beta-propeller fold protein YncE